MIIVNYNGWPYLRDCLRSLDASDAGEAELIVVDNGSADGSVASLRAEFPLVRVLALDRNYGFAEANNIGAGAAGGELLVFLNNDTVVARDWLGPLVEAMGADPAVGAAGSKLLLMGLPGRVNSAGADIVMTGSAYDKGFLDEDSEVYNAAGPRGAVCAASMMVWREEFLSMGGFDPLYFMYFEDVDLCLRYWLSGRTVVYVPRSVALHRFGSTTGPDLASPFRVFYGTRNALFNAIKNFEPRNLARALGMNFLLHLWNFLLHLLHLRPASAFAILRAYGSVFANLHEVLNAREKVQKMRKIPDRFLFENSLVVSFRAAMDEYARLRRARADASGLGHNT